MISRLRRSWAARVAVVGGSMSPTLEAGDWLLVDPDGYAGSLPQAGALVLVPDPRDRKRLLVKRVASLDEQQRLLLAGDAPEASTDSRDFGAVDPSSIQGRPWFRYWPLDRWGRIS